MKTLSTKLIILLTALILCGCANQATLVRALAKDPATVSSKVVTPWGTAQFTRVGAQTNNTVIVSPDGSITIKPGN